MNRWIISLFLASVLVLAQNCSPLNSNNSEENTAPGKSGNGGGYTGITVDTDRTVIVGVESKAFVYGGLPPYEVSSNSTQVTFSSINEKGEFTLIVGEGYTGNTIQIHVKDSASQQITKSISVLTIEFLQLYSPNESSAYVGYFNLTEMDDSKLVVKTTSANVEVGETTFNRLDQIYSFSLSGEMEVAQNIEALDLVPSVGFNFDRVHSVKLFGDYLALGRPFAPDNAYVFSGIVNLYINDKQKWRLVKELTPPDPKDDMRFGSDITFGENVLAISSPKTSLTEGGRVFIYSYSHGLSNITYKGELAFSQDDREFGTKIVIHNKELFVTSYKAVDGKYNPYTSEGRLYVYDIFDLNRIKLKQVFSLGQFTANSGQCIKKIQVVGGRIAMACPNQFNSDQYGFGKVVFFKKSGERWGFDHALERPAYWKPILTSAYCNITATFADEMAFNGRYLSLHSSVDRKIFLYELSDELGKFKLMREWSILTSDSQICSPSLKMNSSQLLITGSDYYKPFVYMLNLSNLPMDLKR